METGVQATEKKHTGTIVRGVGGLYTVLLDTGEELKLRARGSFRHEKLTPTAGDRVNVSEGDGFIGSILPRKTLLDRPSVANLDTLCIVVSAARPAPITLNIDKLTCLALFHGIEPVIIVTKADLDRDFSARLYEIYENCGFETYLTSSEENSGVGELKKRFFDGKSALSAFAGASGAGKSTLLNAIFGEDLKNGAFETGEVSGKTGRGKNTTRAVTLRRIGDGLPPRFLADTPGFSMLDFAAATDFTRDELPELFPELEPYQLKCRYADCTHTKEEGCVIREAAENLIIPPTRRESYLALWEELKDKHKWNLKN